MHRSSTCCITSSHKAVRGEESSGGSLGNAPYLNTVERPTNRLQPIRGFRHDIIGRPIFSVAAVADKVGLHAGGAQSIQTSPQSNSRETSAPEIQNKSLEPYAFRLPTL
ncbi:hypothetical protein PHYPO_G00092630 [Pangasianodon hypophthalmus]|uniref:Uncharacterized protein n=1 Tax=Pangasianodon hypophthalmus TaxID=310915 RepID=A0A5N5LAH8_PANHP|nr:hypothetical protein PHYPO_G00092630 [Pangasianodon hypophthalmus]